MDEFDVDAMLSRYRERATAVQERGLPPVAGEGRKMLMEQAKTDFTDFSLIGRAGWSVEDGQLVLRIQLAG